MIHLHSGKEEEPVIGQPGYVFHGILPIVAFVADRTAAFTSYTAICKYIGIMYSTIYIIKHT